MILKKPAIIFGATVGACLLPMIVFEASDAETLFMVAVNILYFDLIMITFSAWAMARIVQLSRHVFRGPPVAMATTFYNLLMTGLLTSVTRWLVLAIPDLLMELSTSLPEMIIGFALFIIIFLPTIAQLMYAFYTCFFGHDNASNKEKIR